MIKIRKATAGDVAAITWIYNEAILNTTATFDTEPKSVEERSAWFSEHTDRFPVLVAEQAGRVVGWASLSKWSDRCAYSGTAEASIYIEPAQRGKGIGHTLFEAILAEGRRNKLHTVIARIAQDNDVSTHLCEARGFTRIGIMREVGRKFDRLLDVTLLQKIFPGGE